MRSDIAQQLKLQNPAVLVGNFDRPNLVYRIIPRIDARAQALEILRRRPKQAAIVYCISRNDTESMARWLESNGLRAAFIMPAWKLTSGAAPKTTSLPKRST